MSKNKNPPQPHNVEAEEALLGSILIDHRVLHEIAPLRLTGKDFYIVRNGWLFDAALELYQASEAIDLVTLSDKLEREGRLEEIGGAARLTGLMNVTPTSVHGPYYAQIVADYADRRHLIQAALDVTRLAYDEAEEDFRPQAHDIFQTSVNGRGNLALAAGTNWAKLDQVIGPIQWAWSGWLPKGLLTMIVSESGAGKSAVALRIAASFLRGESWPDGQAFSDNTGAVLWCEAEAAQAVNLNRAKDWGLPIEKILTPLADPLEDIQLDSKDHQAAITAMAQHKDVRLIIIDSLSGGTRREGKSSNDMMLIVKFLAELARNTGKYLLLIHHLRKKGMLDSSEKITLDRVRDSSAIVQLARVIWALDTPDPEDEDNKRLSVIKNNLARFSNPIGLKIHEAGINFGDAPQPPRKEKTLKDQTRDLILDLLADGPVPSKKVENEIKEARLSLDTASRVKAELGIISTKPGGIWHWSLPALENDEEIDF